MSLGTLLQKNNKEKLIVLIFLLIFQIISLDFFNKTLGYGMIPTMLHWILKCQTFQVLLTSEGLPWGSVAKTPCSQCSGSGFDPWSGNLLQLKFHMLQVKVPHAVTKIEDPVCHS